MKNTQKISLLLISALSIYIGIKISEAYAAQAKNEEQKTYIINKDTKCGKKGSEKLIYCVDKQGTPVTGSVYKLKNGSTIRHYTFKDGYLDGVSEIYDNNGHLMEARPYTQGILNGNVYNYNRLGKIIAIEPYKDGKKEGIATYSTDKNIYKMVYIEDKSNGDMLIYDRKWIEFKITPEIASGESMVQKDGVNINNLLKNKNKTGIIYRFTNTNGEITKGIYYHLHCPDDVKDCIPTIVSTEIPPLIIKWINNKCLKIHTSINRNACAAYEDGSSEKCNNAYVKDYFQKCKKENKTTQDGGLKGR